MSCWKLGSMGLDQWVSDDTRYPQWKTFETYPDKNIYNMSLVSRVTQKMALVSYDKITPILHHRRVSSPPRVHMRLRKQSTRNLVSTHTFSFWKFITWQWCPSCSHTRPNSDHGLPRQSKRSPCPLSTQRLSTCPSNSCTLKLPKNCNHTLHTSSTPQQGEPYRVHKKAPWPPVLGPEPYVKQLPYHDTVPHEVNLLINGVWVITQLL